MEKIIVPNPNQTAINLADKYGKGALKFAKEKAFVAESIPSIWFWNAVIKQLTPNK